jgi:hypothetical protein
MPIPPPPPKPTPDRSKKPLPPLPPIGRWQPTSPRQRLRIVLVAIATVLVLWSLLLFRPGAKVREFPPDPPLPACKPGQTSGCVGGTASVQLLPAASQALPSPSSAAASAAR